MIPSLAPVNDAAYGGNPTFGLRSNTHRVDVDLGRKNDRVLVARQFNLELLEKKKIAKRALVRCGNIAATNLPDRHGRLPADHSS
jgi:hypothetical protein